MRKEFIEAVSKIQSTLNAPKSQLNKFGGYKYRNCEDILAALKPMLNEKKLVLIISDAIELIADRIYVKATVRLEDSEGNYIENSAFARESLTKKGMDDSQITGAASSYARKYALNGLLCIDDTRDADSQDNSKTTKPSNFSSNPPSNLKEGVFDTSGVIKNQLDKAKDLGELKKIWSKCNTSERLKLEPYKDKIKEKLINETMERKKTERESQELDNEDVEI